MPNLRCRRRCILLLHPIARTKSGDEHLLWNDDYVSFTSRQTARGIHTADASIVRAVAGEPLGDLPQRFALHAVANDDVPPPFGDEAVFREERLDDLALYFRSKERERNSHVLFRGKVLPHSVAPSQLLP